MRTRLYHHTAPKGEVFTDQESHDKAVKNGWVSAPWLIEVGNKKEVYVAPNLSEPKTLCACGCGTPVEGKWVKGHHFRGRKNGHKQNNKSPG